MPELIIPNKISRTSSNSKVIDGKKIANEVLEELKAEIENWRKQSETNPCPYIAALVVGDDPASRTYVNNKMKAGKSVGIQTSSHSYPEDILESDLIKEIEKFNNDEHVHGIIVQLPLPSHICERNVCNAVSAEKDVDGFHTNNIGKLTQNINTFIPATAMGVVELLKRSNIPTFGKNVVICGRSKNVGLPIALLLHSDANYECPGGEATTTICHRNTPPKQLEYFTKNADIIISATGVPNLIKPEMVKPGVCILDVGIIRITENGKTRLVGDVDFEGVSKVAGRITPVPGGVGPMTVAMLMVNTFKAAKAIVNKRT